MLLPKRLGVLCLFGFLLVASFRAAADECKDGSCAPRELNLPHDEDETESPDRQSKINLLQIEKGKMGSILAYDDLERKVRVLMSSRYGVGGHYSSDKYQHYMPVHDIMEASKFAWSEKPEAALILGTGGAGNVYNFLKKAGVSSIKIVEQDYQLNQVAQKHFGLDVASSDTEYSGPKAWLDANSKLGQEYDLIIHDAFSLGYRPVDSLTKASIQKIHKLLSDDGMFILKWYGHILGPQKRYTVDLFKTVKQVFPNVRLFADRKPSWSSPKPFAHLVFFATKNNARIAFNLPDKVKTTQDPVKGKRIHTWKNFQEWEQVFDESELASASLISQKDNVLIKWYKKTARDFKGDMRYKVPLRVWNLAHDYLKISRDNPYEDNDDDDVGYDTTGEAEAHQDPRLKNIPPEVLEQLKKVK